MFWTRAVVLVIAFGYGGSVTEGTIVSHVGCAADFLEVTLSPASKFAASTFRSNHPQTLIQPSDWKDSKGLPPSQCSWQWDSAFSPSGPPVFRLYFRQCNATVYPIYSEGPYPTEYYVIQNLVGFSFDFVTRKPIPPSFHIYAYCIYPAVIYLNGTNPGVTVNPHGGGGGGGGSALPGVLDLLANVNGSRASVAMAGQPLQFDLMLNSSARYSYRGLLPIWCSFSPSTTGSYNEGIRFIDNGCPVRELITEVSRPRRVSPISYVTDFRAFTFDKTTNFLFVHCQVLLCLTETECNKSCWYDTKARSGVVQGYSGLTIPPKSVVGPVNQVVQVIYSHSDPYSTLSPVNPSKEPSGGGGHLVIIIGAVLGALLFLLLLLCCFCLLFALLGRKRERDEEWEEVMFEQPIHNLHPSRF